MTTARDSARFSEVATKVRAGQRLDEGDALALFAHPDLLALGGLANEERERRHGDRAYFNRNVRLEVTNVCVASCRFCSFARLEKGMPGASTMTVEQAMTALREKIAGIEPPTEVHVVNGLDPNLDFTYYEELLRALATTLPGAHRKCFTAVEIHWFAQHYGLPLRTVLERLRAAGLQSLPGGGAEIFHPEVRTRICDDKATADEWLQVHRVAHELGLFTNATMLYGHVETFAHRVDHMLRLRALQDESIAAGRAGRFQAFIPLAFHPDGNGMRELPGPTGVDDLRTLAVSRLVLDNFDHIKAYWVSSTPKVAQIGLSFGADDVDGTIVGETIYGAAGKRAPEGLRVDDLVRLIREAGRLPIERDTLYRVVREYARADAEGAFKVRERRQGKHLRVLGGPVEGGAE
ncbi:MAG: aminofutalosine synthase MqnE [Polyangiales bacterium]